MTGRDAFRMAESEGLAMAVQRHNPEGSYYVCTIDTDEGKNYIYSTW